ncbi:MAG: YdcF family protein [Oligoflexia bacterium]|nr:YdcF family protein [Oligoflexia bacterium]
MLFEKKYTFESKKTKTRRYVANILFFILTFIGVYGLFCLLIIYISHYENKRSQEAFYKKSPDLLAIFTGDAGRIQLGLQKALEYNGPQIFITGVESSNSVKTIMQFQKKDLSQKMYIDSDLIEIDYLARNTVENVISVLRYLRDNPEYQRVLIVSSDYHLMRIKIILNSIKGPNDDFDFYYMGVENPFFNWHSIKILIKEVYKTINSYGFLLLWDSDIKPLEHSNPNKIPIPLMISD